jgi:hypothetical protein
LASDGKGTFRFDHNIWSEAGGGVAFVWGSTRITSWSGWRELGFDPHGRNAPANLAGSVGSGTSGVELGRDSPAIGTGANLKHAPMGMGRRDYFGTPVPQAGRYDAGAAAFPDPKPTTSSNASPVPHAMFTPSSHVAEVETGCSSSGSGNSSVVPRGGAVRWCIRMAEAGGSPAPGELVTTTVYSPSWDSITATIRAVTDSSGTAQFTFQSHSDDPTGTYFLFVSQVVPAPSTYYDSYQNFGDTGRFTLG